MSGINWNAIPPSQHLQFLEAADLDRLPEAAALNEAQLKILTGIVGEQTGSAGAAQRADTVSQPQLPKADMNMDWSDIMMMVTTLKVKQSDLQSKCSLEEMRYRKDLCAQSNEGNLKRITDVIKKLDELLDRRFSPLAWLAALAGLGVSVIATIATGGVAAPAVLFAFSGLGGMKLYELDMLEPIVDFIKENPEISTALFEALKNGSLFLASLNPAAVIGMLVVAGIAAYAVLNDDGGRVRNAVSDAVNAVVDFLSNLASKILGCDIPKDAFDKDLAAWMLQNQARMTKEFEELEERIAGMSQSAFAVLDKIEDMAGTGTKFKFHAGM